MAAPGWTLVALAVLAGSTLPQIGAFARARWTALLGDGHALRTALALESLIDEAAFVVGPVLVTALAAGVDPAAGLVAAIVVIAAAGLAFAAQRGTEPTTTGERDARARRRLGPPRSGALAYGAIAWRIAARRRFVTAVAAFAAATALTALLGYRTFPVAGRDTLTRAPRTVVSPDRDDVTGRGGHTVPEDPAVGDRPSDG